MRWIYLLSLVSHFVVFAPGGAKQAQAQAAADPKPDEMRRECSAGNARSCSILGTLYYNGTGVKADEVQAQSLLRQACDMGDPAGCYGLGNVFAIGHGDTHDHVHAAELFKRACDGNYPEGCT